MNRCVDMNYETGLKYYLRQPDVEEREKAGTSRMRDLAPGHEVCPGLDAPLASLLTAIDPDRHAGPAERGND